MFNVHRMFLFEQMPLFTSTSSTVSTTVSTARSDSKLHRTHQTIFYLAQPWQQFLELTEPEMELV